MQECHMFVLLPERGRERQTDYEVSSVIILIPIPFIVELGMRLKLLLSYTLCE